MANETIGSATGANNVTGAAADRTSPSAWEGAQSANGTGTIIYIGGYMSTSQVDLDAAYTLELTAHADAALNAPTYAAATSRARMKSSAGECINVAGSGAWTISKIALLNNGGGGADVIQAGGASLVVRRCVIHGDDTNVSGLRCSDGALEVTNVAIFATRYGIILQLGDSIAAYQCSVLCTDDTAYRLIIGTFTTDACIAQGSGVGWSAFAGSIGGDFNVSEDTTAPGSSSTKYYRSTSGWFANTSSGTEDLSLAAGAQGKWVTDGKDAIDQTGWPGDVATDIVGTTRSAPIDPGVWQTPAAAGTTVARLLNGGLLDGGTLLSGRLVR